MAAGMKDVEQPKSKMTPNYRRPTVNWCNMACNYDQKFHLPPRPSPPPLMSSCPRKSRMSTNNGADNRALTTPLVSASPQRSTRPISDNPTSSTASTSSSSGQRKPPTSHRSNISKTQIPSVKPVVIDHKPSSSKPKRSLYPPRVPTAITTTKRRPLELSKGNNKDLKKKSKQIKQQETKFALPPIGEGKHKRAETSPSFLLVTHQEEGEGEDRSICDINLEDELADDDEIVAKVKQNDHHLQEEDEEEMKQNGDVKRRNRKVKALVGAFETVISLHEVAVQSPPTVTTSLASQPPHAQQQSQQVQSQARSQPLIGEVKTF